MNHNLDTSTWTDLRLSPETVQWVEDQDIVIIHTFIILVVRSNIKVCCRLQMTSWEESPYEENESQDGNERPDELQAS